MEIYNGVTENGNEIAIRFLEEDDLDDLLASINTLSREKTFITLQGEQLTKVDEKKYLDKFIQRKKESKGFFLCVFVEGKYAGGASIYMEERNSSHVGIFGIALLKEFRNEGTGRTLIQKTLDQAKILLPQLRILTLSLYEPNTVAKRLYDEFGFVEYGRLEKGVICRDEFTTEIYMKKEFKI